MKNWLGQDLAPGDYVWRGARSGNTSEFKVGRVLLIDSKGIQVEWLYKPGYIWLGRDLPVRDHMAAIFRTNSKGRPDIDSLCKISPYEGVALEHKAKAFEALRKMPINKMSQQDAMEFIANYAL